MSVSHAKFVVLLTFAVISYVTPNVISSYDFDSQILDEALESVKSYEENDDKCKPDCDSQIFCSGDILHDVQTNEIYRDKKNFVDAKLRFSEADIVKKYQTLKKQSNGQLSREQLTQFVNDNFYNPEDVSHSGLEKWTPPDFTKTPSIVKHVRDEKLQKFALDLNEVWKNLSVKVSQDVKEHPDRYSMLYLPNGFIKAGGRFREMYYWDMFWVVRGLLICDMRETARGIIENMIYLVKNLTFVPNGNRKYYIQRSQPPLLIQMAEVYRLETNDDEFIKKNLLYFDLEFRFWTTNRKIKVEKDKKEYEMFRYNAESCFPRPESYAEDYNNSKLVPEAEKRRFYTGMRSGAESGWDFSSRHIRARDNSNNASLEFIDTQSFVYVDLNSILQSNAIILSDWHRRFGKQSSANKYKSFAENLLEAIDTVLWNEEAGTWLDWDFKIKKSRNYFYPSNLTPLWTRSYKQSNADDLAIKAVEYLYKNKIISKPSNLSAEYWGIPTSLNNNGQQWDMPNAWAPLQAIVIQGLERTGHPVAGHVAFSLAKNWMNTTYTAYSSSLAMFEKYNATNFGKGGGGGEYDVQTGFGWSNGYIFEILRTYGKFLQSGSK